MKNTVYGAHMEIYGNDYADNGFEDMVADLSFNYHELRAESNVEVPGETAPKSKPASINQIALYKRLCVSKRVEEQDVATFTFESMNIEIQRLNSFHPASERQIELVEEKVANVSSMVANMNFTPEQVEQLRTGQDVVSRIIIGTIDGNLDVVSFTSGLTGGREGTASVLIEKLIGVEKQFTSKQPATRQQLESIVQMFLCPDVGFEEYGIERRIDLGEGLWRKPTPQEFASSIMRKINRQDASQFIDKYRGVFYEWRKTRVRPEQIRYIRDLQARMADDSKLSVIESHITIEGDIVEVNTKSAVNVKGTAYVPMSEEQLVMLSIDNASDLISQLKLELERRDSFVLEDTQDYNELRKANSIQEAIDIEFTEFQDLMFRLEAIAGYEDEELHQMANYNLVADDNPESNKENRAKIRGFMKHLIETGAITYYGLIEVSRNSITAQRILLDM